MILKLILIWCCVAMAALFAAGSAVSLATAVRPAHHHFAAGESIPGLKPLLHGRAFNVLLFGRDSCGACEKSAPFLRMLQTAVTERADAELLVFSVGSSWEPLPGLHSIRTLSPGMVHDLNITVVPTILMVDGRSVVVGSQQGVPTLQEERRLVDLAKGGR